MDRSDSAHARLAAAAEAAMIRGCEVFAARRAALFWQESPAGDLVCIASIADTGAAGWVGRSLPPGVGMAGRTVAEGRPVSTPDLLADTRVPVAPWLRERLEREGLGAVAAAPVRVRGVIRGALGLLHPPGRIFDDEALSRLGSLADEVGRDLEAVLPAPGGARRAAPSGPPTTFCSGSARPAAP